jgi:hypothetical protein
MMCASCDMTLSNSCLATGACGCGTNAECVSGQHCVAGNCVCDATTCASGCCAADGGCHNGELTACGSGGGACTDCTGEGNACANGICYCETHALSVITYGASCNYTPGATTPNNSSCQPSACGQFSTCGGCAMCNGETGSCDQRSDGCWGGSGVTPIKPSHCGCGFATPDAGPCPVGSLCQHCMIASTCTSICNDGGVTCVPCNR